MCYIIPALMGKGLALVVSPLIGESGNPKIHPKCQGPRDYIADGACKRDKSPSPDAPHKTPGKTILNFER